MNCGYVCNVVRKKEMFCGTTAESLREQIKKAGGKYPASHEGQTLFVLYGKTT
jgi:hypothetical protein